MLERNHLGVSLIIKIVVSRLERAVSIPNRYQINRFKLVIKLAVVDRGFEKFDNKNIQYAESFVTDNHKKTPRVVFVVLSIYSIYVLKSCSSRSNLNLCT